MCSDLSRIAKKNQWHRASLISNNESRKKARFTLKASQTTVPHCCLDMLLTTFGSILLVATAIWAKRKNITIGGIVADKNELPFALHRTGPAIEMGVEKLREIIGDEADVTFIFNVTTEFCVADLVGAIAAEMYYKHKVSAFIGPGMCYV